MTAETMRLDAGELAALVGSRLCHDLVSPLGAIGNGVELLEISGSFPGIETSPELTLITEAVAAARGRIQAFRMAFGQAKSDQQIGLPELTRLVEGMSSQGRLKLTLDAEGDFARSEVRMLLLALMCIESAMPWGGQVVILRAGQGWRLVGEAQRMKLDDGLWAWLLPDSPHPRRVPIPSEVQFALLSEAVAQSGRRMSCDIDDKGVEILF